MKIGWSTSEISSEDIEKSSRGTEILFKTANGKIERAVRGYQFLVFLEIERRVLGVASMLVFIDAAGKTIVDQTILLLNKRLSLKTFYVDFLAPEAGIPNEVHDQILATRNCAVKTGEDIDLSLSSLSVYEFGDSNKKRDILTVSMKNPAVQRDRMDRLQNQRKRMDAASQQLSAKKHLH